MNTQARLGLPLFALLLAACPVPERTDYSVSEGDPATELTSAITFVGVDFEVREGQPPAATGTAIPLIGGDGIPVAIVPGAGGVLSFDYEVEVAESIDLVIHFSGADSHIVVHLDLTGEATTGTVDIPFGVATDACDALAEIQHAIQCNETLQGLGGEVADYFVQEMTLLCDAQGDDDDDDDDDDSADDDDAAASSLEVSGSWVAGPSSDTCTGSAQAAGPADDLSVAWSCLFANAGLACSGTWDGLVVDGAPTAVSLDCLGLEGTAAFTSGPPLAGQADFDNGTAQVTLSFVEPS